MSGVTETPIRGKGYTKHTCVNCDGDFIGRKNAKFCGMTCKTIFNNEKAYKRQETTKTTILILQKNYQILKKALDQNENKISHVELIRRGYKTNIFSGKVKTRDQQGKVFDADLCCDIALIPFDKETFYIKKYDAV